MPKPTLDRIEVPACDIQAGDRVHRNGKTRFVASNNTGGRVRWRVQTTGTRSPSVMTFEPDATVVVWRPVVRS